MSRRKVDVPEQISVAGFDNTIASFESRLTSYDFNFAGIANRMLWCIQRYDPGRVSRHQPPIEVEGMVIARRTTGRARKGK